MAGGGFAMSLYRALGAAYLVMFIIYFSFRASYSIGERQVPWRVFVLVVELMASMSVCFVVILKLKQPWTPWVDQPDGSRLLWYRKREEQLEKSLCDPKRLIDTVGAAAPAAGPATDAAPTEDAAAIEPSVSKAEPTEYSRAAESVNEDRAEDSIQSNVSVGVSHARRVSFTEATEVDETSPMMEGEKYVEVVEQDGTVTRMAVKKGDVEMGLEEEKKEADTAAPADGEDHKMVPGEDKYILRFLVPCYREDLEIVRRTCEAALTLDYPSERVFVYLCDDGNDPTKREWVEKMQAAGYPNIVYVTRPVEFKGHGKAGNLNYTLKHIIYGGEMTPSTSELVGIFDADMICATHYAKRMVPYFAVNPAVVMVQSPQTFHNLPMNADFFDAHNVNFFQYMLPAMCAWNTTTCCGTNFVVSARALKQCGWFPTLSVTEDMYLAMKLLESGGLIRYHAEHLAVGEAPEDLRQIFQQRSRWAKGTIQIAVRDNPLFSEGLNWMQRLSFFNACWSYLTSAFFNPLFVVINSMGIVFGVFPVTEIKFATAMLFVLYYSLFYTMIHFTPSPFQHYLSLWIVGKMGHFFSFMSFKAIINVVKAEIGSNKTITFKVTQKKVGVQGGTAVSAEAEGPKARDSQRKDLAFHAIMVVFILFVIFYGVSVVIGQATLPEIDDERSVFQKRGIRLFCICWMVQFFIAYSLPIWYAVLPRAHGAQALALKVLSGIDSIISFMLIIVTVLLFNLDWLPYLPPVDSITDYRPATTPHWSMGSSAADLTRLEIYIYQTGAAGQIPTIVLYNRPFRDASTGLSAGGVSSFDDYYAYLDAVQKRIVEIGFPVVVVAEPDFLFEVTKLSDTQNTNTDDGWSMGEQVFAQDTWDGPQYATWFSYHKTNLNLYLTKFTDMARKLPKYSRLYIDGTHPFYFLKSGKKVLDVVGLELRSMYQKLRLQNGATWVRGFAFNVANFYGNADVEKMGAYAMGSYQMRYIEDTSRNGGAFSARNMTDIDKCKFDPPFIEAGNEPNWFSSDPKNPDPVVDTLVTNGLDAKMWIKILGEADGRMWPAGEAHSCLINHEIECTETCPDIPQGFKSECQC